jgi:uncharacterized membrane protein
VLKVVLCRHGTDRAIYITLLQLSAIPHIVSTLTALAYYNSSNMVQSSDILLILVAILFPPAAAAFIAGCVSGK